MPPSNRAINYRLRAAKAIERKMMCEALARLSVLYPVDQFQYVGYGSTSFADFILAHRMLGISKMVSIERQAISEKRFRLNVPFGCIDLRFGESNDVLPDIDVARPTVMWLDDDQSLSRAVLRDVEHAIGTLQPPSVFIVSVNASPWSEVAADPQIAAKRLAKLKELVGADRVPPSLEGRSLSGWGTASAYYAILADAISAAVADRAAVADVCYQQIFHFQYEDGAKMLTVGGLLLRPSDVSACNAAGLQNLFYVRSNAEPFRIKVPILTFREMRHLDQVLPDGMTLLEQGLFPASDVEAYAAIYRYLPLYAETDL